MSTQTAPNLANSGTRPYSAADRAALPRLREQDVARIAAATSTEDASQRAAQALLTAAYWIAQGETEQAHRLTTEAAAAYREAIA